MGVRVGLAWLPLLVVAGLTLPLATTGKLYLQQPARPPRVYAAAPSGVEVTVLRAVQRMHGTSTPATDPHFSIHHSNETDHQYFTIDEKRGVIKTARYVEGVVGHQYRIMVVVLASGKAIYKELKITVTQYNQFRPVFRLHHYSSEVMLKAGTGTRLLTVMATDQDLADYNRDIHYFLADSTVTPFRLNHFLDPPLWSPLRVDPITGDVRVARNLNQSTSPLQLLVGAVDGGSPRRYTLANLTVFIREMPAPRGVVIANTTQSSFTVCWSPPTLGTPEGYILSYNPVDGHVDPSEGFLNLTTDQLHKKLSGWNNNPKGPTRGDGVVEVYRYCAVVTGLMSWTEYVVGVRAWAGSDLSMAAPSIKATTTSDDCREGVCRVGNCSLQQDPPGYSCNCPIGYYGENCQYHNPCLPDNPCSHLGRCQNHTDGSYTCECLQGFYGENCTQLNPCDAVDTNPCINGGTCFSGASGEYECRCPKGYYGVRCEHRNPCFTKPCENGGSCARLTDDTFSCSCPSGYSGKKCENEINECSLNPCKRGRCTDLINDYRCHCPRGWGGKNCDQDLDDCASSPCFNGATCIDGQDSYVCDCAHGYSGIRCGIPESCSAHTTLLSTGEFFWPATHHGETVTIPCPYGTQTHTITEENNTTEAASFTQTPPTPSNTAADDDDDYDDGVGALALTKTPGMTTTYASWDGASFQISRKSRDVHPSYSTIYDKDSLAEKRRRILASLRGITSKKSERRHQSRRRFRKGGQTRHGTDTHTHSKGERSQHQDIRKQTEAEQGMSGGLKTQSDPTRESMIGELRAKESISNTKLSEDTDETLKIVPTQDLAQIYTKLSRRKEEDLRHTHNSDHRDKNKNIPENLTLQDKRTVSQKEDSDNSKKREKKNVAGGHGTPEALLDMKSNKEMKQVNSKAFRTCKLLPNGQVKWMEPDTTMCREKATLDAEETAEEVATLTSSPSAVDSEMFTRAADQLAKIVNHAIKDPAVANNLVNALSNMMEVNDSVVADVNKQTSVTKQILNTINTFTQNVHLEVGKPVKIGSQHLVVEARLLDSTLKENITFHPDQQGNESSMSQPKTMQRRDIHYSRNEMKPYISLPPQALALAETSKIRLEFVSFANDKFFQSERRSGLPVISAKITNTKVNNLSQPVLYYIPLADYYTSESLHPTCVFWDEEEGEWASDGLKTVEIDAKTLCQASHLTAFSVLLDPLPAHLGSHAQTLSIITYIGIILSTAALIATIATYTLFRTLNRDRSGKIVMNLSLVLLLLNIVFIIAVNLKPPSVACITMAAMLHYLVVAAFAWMLVEAANMYQLLITVFASAETHFMAKRVVAAWGSPAVLVVITLAIDKDVYGDSSHGHCVISPVFNPVLYYSTYLAPICLVLLVNCVVFVMVTRVLCQRRPRSNKPRATTSESPSLELPITLAQVRGAVTVVALLGITWVAGALSIGGARIVLQYLFCLTTPLQGLIIFIVRVAQHQEARTSWMTLFTTGTLRRRPPTTISNYSSGHTHSTLSTTNTPKNIISSTQTTSTRISLRNSAKTSINTQKNGSIKSLKGKNGSISNNSTKHNKNQETNPTIGTIFARLVRRFSTNTQENENLRVSVSKKKSEAGPDLAPINLSELECHNTMNKEQSYFCEAISDKSSNSSHNSKCKRRSQSLLLLQQTNSPDSVMATHSSTSSSHDCINPQFPLLSSNYIPEELIEVGIPSSLVPRRSLGSLMFTAANKEGDDSSWHFVRPPPDGHSNPVSEGESALVENDYNGTSTTKEDTNSEELQSQMVEKKSETQTDCIVLSGQRIATNKTAISMRKNVVAPSLIRANSELHVSSSLIKPADLRRSASVYTLGEWEDLRSSLA